MELPFPSRAYLEIHAASAKIVHMSGATEYMDKILRDMEDIRVLSNDGTSAEVLEYALLPCEVLVFGQINHVFLLARGSVYTKRMKG